MEKTLSVPLRENKIASDGVIGMVLLLATEAMFFAGLISAYVVNKAGAVTWPPAGQPRLPVEVTALNTVILIASAFFLFYFSKNYKIEKDFSKKVKFFLNMALAGGIAFVLIQGTEWSKLIYYGLTTSSSIYGAFFYLIIGLHGIHVIAGLLILLYLNNFLRKNNSVEAGVNKIRICSLYWYFVVGIWPVLYVLVYLT